jgi:23S rRNA (uracil1939-C5)-methyltransferase
MIYGGDGLSRLPNGKAVFLPFVLPGEEIRAEVVEEKSGFARARLTEVLKPSETRVVPECVYFSSCGGCHYQHADYATQLEIKRQVLRDTFRRTAKLDWQNEIVTHSADPWHYRNRTRIKVRGGSDFCAGYYRMFSHELLAVEQCPISSPAINRALERFWRMGRDRFVPAGVHEIEFFANHDDSRLLLEVYGDLDGAIARQFLQALQSHLSEVAGAVFFPATQGNTRAGGTLGDPFLVYAAGDKSFRVTAGAFFQTNRHLANNLLKTVVTDLRGKTALDLYAGGGLFANHLAERFAQVIAVESSPASLADLEFNGAKNVTAVGTTAEQFLLTAAKLNAEVVIVDPPRAGLGDKTAGLLASLLVPRIAYLSCDPATLARDLRVLLQSGYRVEEVHFFDLFPQTFHIESLVRLARV